MKLNLKYKFWDEENKQMILSLDKYAVYNETTIMIPRDENVWYYEYVVPIPALPIRDVNLDTIYHGDILQCEYSDYQDPSGIHYPNSKLIYIIADIYDAYSIPKNVKIVGNKYENPELYRQVLYENELKGCWETIQIWANDVLCRYTHIRKGQALFNALVKYNSDVADKIRGTIYDCFHDDSKIEAFQDRVIDLWIEELEKS